jgi:hypothetical protein
MKASTWRVPVRLHPLTVKKARGLVTELPRSTRLGPGTGIWHQVTVGQEKLRVHRRFFKDMQIADSRIADSEAATA